MALRKKNTFLSLANSYLIDSPQPSTISYWWNIGSLLGICLMIQLATGIFLAMHYSSNLELAFISVEHIMRDVSSGWALRYAHANGAAFFFILIYAHMARGIYYGSYKSPRVAVWIIGVIIFLVLIITGFLGFTYYSPIYIYINYILILYFTWRLLILYNIYNINIFHNKVISYTFQQRGIHKINTNINNNNNNNNNENDENENENKDLEINILNNKEYSNSIEGHVICDARLDIIIFDNLLDKKVNILIKKITKDMIGVYLIYNKITGNYYIGSSYKNIYNKYLLHFKYLNTNHIIKKTILKYGINNFKFMIIYYKFEEDQLINKNIKDLNKELLKIEESYIKLYKPKYNILTKTNIKSSNLNKNISEESINNLRITALNRPIMLEETKLKCKIHNKPIILYFYEIINNKNIINNNEYYIYNSIKELCIDLGCSSKTIYRALKYKDGYLKKKYLIKSLNIINNCYIKLI